MSSTGTVGEATALPVPEQAQHTSKYSHRPHHREAGEPSASERAQDGSPLSDVALAAAPQAISAETRRAYSRALRRIEAQLKGRSTADGPLSEALSELADEGAGRSTLTQIVAALRFAARIAGRPDPVGPSCDLVLRAHRRATQPARQVAALDWEHADAAACAAAAQGGPVGLRDAAIVAVMSDALLRVGEAAALDVADVAAQSDGAGVVTVHRSKTDQTGEGAALFLGPPTIRRVRAWLDAAQITSGPLFRRIRKGGHVGAERLSSRSIREVVRCAAEAVGVAGASGHSLRIGAAQSLVRAGATLPEAQQAGRWASPTMPAHYARGELAAQGAVARLRHATVA